MDEKEAAQQLIQSGDIPTQDKIKSLVEKEFRTSVDIIQKPEFPPQKFTVKDFTTYFRNRYTYIKGLLINRPEIENAISISKAKSQNSKITLIATINHIAKLPTGTIRLTLEDLSGRISAIISVKNSELIKKAQSLVHDDILAFKGSTGRGVFFVEDVAWPDIPHKQRFSAPDEVYVAFTGDLHVGSNNFLPKQFEKFISWLNGEIGDEKQKDIAEKTKYVIFLGDLADGVGIYPGQEKELEIKDIYEQYKTVAEYLARIPKDKHIIIISGNHDMIRICEPQPALYTDIAAPLYELPNAIILPNPATVRVHKQHNFPGVDILLYHGYGFDYFVDNVEALRLVGGYDAPEKVIEFLLKRRHLAPTYGSTTALPLSKDPLLIQDVPNIMATGHVHKAKISQYKNTLTISCSCWQAKTEFEERVGHNPDPCYVPIVNLKTWKATMLSFKD